MHKLLNILNEWKIDFIPKGWKKLSVDPNPNLEKEIKIESYGAPMKGWDYYNRLDTVSIYKTPEKDARTNAPLEVKYEVKTAEAIRNYTEAIRFDTYSEAKSYALEVMNKLTKSNDSY